MLPTAVTTILSVSMKKMTWISVVLHLVRTRSRGHLLELWVINEMGLAVWCHRRLASSRLIFLLVPLRPHSPLCGNTTDIKIPRSRRADIMIKIFINTLLVKSICLQVTNENMYNIFFHFCSVIYKISCSKHEIGRRLPFITFMIKKTPSTHIRTHTESNINRRIITL